MEDIALGNPQSFNKYSYALNNPYTFHDASGLKPADGRALHAAGMSAASNAGKQAIKQVIEAAAQSLHLTHLVGMNTSGVDKYFQSGSERNDAIEPLFGHSDRSAKFYYQFACTPISDRAVLVIMNAIVSGQAGGVGTVRTLSRGDVNWGGSKMEAIKQSYVPNHTAILIQLHNGEEYVIDWHRTLDINHPLIQSKSEWCGGNCGLDANRKASVPTRKDVRWDQSLQPGADPRLEPEKPLVGDPDWVGGGRFPF